MSRPARDRRSESFVPGVRRELERAIAAGELRGGHRINESALALKLGISCSRPSPLTTAERARRPFDHVDFRSVKWSMAAIMTTAMTGIAIDRQRDAAATSLGARRNR